MPSHIWLIEYRPESGINRLNANTDHPSFCIPGPVSCNHLSSNYLTLLKCHTIGVLVSFGCSLSIWRKQRLSSYAMWSEFLVLSLGEIIKLHTCINGTEYINNECSLHSQILFHSQLATVASLSSVVRHWEIRVSCVWRGVTEDKRLIWESNMSTTSYFPLSIYWRDKQTHNIITH